MSKGNSYWGTAKGKIGNIVVSTNKGQRIERKYQPDVLNPRTKNQQLQRARFANAVKFYKRAYANFFRFAYEDKRANESDFNAFMRHNTSNRMSVLKKSQVKGTFPAVGNSISLSAGSLANPSIVDARGVRPYLSLKSLASDSATVGNVSSALIADYNLIDGDIITIVRVSTSVTSLDDANPADYPAWEVSQFLVNSSSEVLLSSINEHLGILDGKGMALDTGASPQSVWYGVVFSRKQTQRTLIVSNSYLLGNANAYALYISAQRSKWLEAALVSWDASGDAVLEGSLVNSTLTNVVISTIKGNDVPYISDLSFDNGVSSTVELTGSGFDSMTIDQFSMIGGDVTNLVINSDESATITLTGNGSHPNTWSLVYNTNVIARHDSVTAAITSANPARISNMSAGQTATITLTGTNMDALTSSQLTVNGEGLSITRIQNSGSTQATLTLTASANVESATISYNGETIVTVEQVEVSITSGTELDGGSGNHTANLTGTGLDTLSASSFSTTGDVEITSYNASSDTAATLGYSSGDQGGSISLGSTWTATVSGGKSGGGE